MMDRKKIFELDKICRVCTSERREMRPLFSEKVAEMLMDCTSVRVEPIEGWPDKICVQCVHAVSRNYAFKMLVERSDKELREYIRSLTVQMAREESGQKTHQQQQQFSLQQKQKKLLQRQIKEQQQQIEEQQQKLQEQRELLNHQQQQLAQPIVLVQQQQTNAKAKLKPLAKKPPRTMKKHVEQVLQQQQQHQEPAQQQHPQLQQHQQIRQVTSQISTLPISTQSVAPPILQPAPQLLPTTTTTAMPQQILLPNGQIITTTQIVTHPGTPQLAQLISTTPNPQATVTATSSTPTMATQTLSATQSQYLPQLLQTPNGQTLQIVQQANGTQTLQLVQLVPQRNMTTNPANVTGGMSNDLLSADGVDVQLVDETEVEEDLNDSIYEHLGTSKTDIETIVLEDESSHQHQHHHHHHHHQLHHEMLKDEEEELTQTDTEELEFFEDMDSTPSQHVDDEMPEQLLHNEECDEEEDEEGGFIIEELHMDEEMLEDESEAVDNEINTSDGSVIQIMETSGMTECEYITDDAHPTQLGEHDDDVDELDYTIMEATDDMCEAVDEHGTNIIEDVDVKEVLHEIKINNALHGTVLEFTGESISSPHTGSPAKKQRRNHTSPNNNLVSNAAKVAAANTRQLEATASVIAAVSADDNYEIDAKLVSDFIRQQTSPLGSGRYICNLCNTEFRQFKGLRNHMHSHTNWIRANCKKQPQCELCLKSFKGPGMLRMHMKTHDAESVAPTCNICNKTFKSKAILYRHRQTHQQRAYACGVSNCRKTFSNAVNLRGHVERKHPDYDLQNYKCGECCDLFDDIESLQTHVDCTGHGAAGVSCALSLGNDCDLSDVVSDTTNTLTTPDGGSDGATPGNDATVIMGSSGEVFFVTQA